MKYCEFCGKALDDKEICTCEEAITNKNKKTKLIKKSIVLSGIIIAIVLALIISISVISVSNRVDPFEYIEVTFSGYNSNGSAEIDFDIDKLIIDLIGEDPDELEDSILWEETYDRYYEAIEYEYTPGSLLSNNDEVTVTVIISDALSDKVNGGSRKYNVTNLPDVETVDVFNNVSVHFEGVSGDAHIEIEKNNEFEYAEKYIFEIDNKAGLSNGDIVTVTISNVDSIANEFYVLPKETYKQFTVENLPEYVSKVSQIPNELIKKLSDEFLKYKSEEVVDDWMFSYSDIEYYGTYFLTGKEDAFLADINRLEIFVSYDEYKNGEYWGTIYTPLCFTDILIYPDGTIDIDYEDGENSTFTTDMSNYTNKYEEKYNIAKID